MKKTQFNIFLFVLLLASISTTLRVSGQSWQSDYITNAKLFTPKDGLSHRSVNCLVEDNRKLIWIGTRNGLNRFDGQSFKAFYTEQGLQNNRILDLYIDGAVLWCLHENEVNNTYTNFTLFHTIQERCLSLTEYLGNDLPFKKADIAKVDLKNKALYFYLKNHKVYQYTAQKGFVALSFYKKGEKILAQNENGLFIIWMEAKDYYLRIVDKKGKELVYSSPDFLGEKLRIMYQGTAPDGGTWLSFKHETGDEFFKINRNSTLSRFNAYKSVADELGIFPKKFTRKKSFAYVAQYDAFLYSCNEYFLLMSMAGEVLHFEKSKILQNVDGVDLIQKNTFWLPSKTGFYQLEFKRNNFINYLNNQNLKDFRQLNRQGEYLYFNSYSGVFRLNPDIGELPQKVFPKALSSLVDKSENLWLSDYDVLIRHNLKTGKKRQFDIPKVLEIWSLFEDKRGYIWYSKKGLHTLNPNTGESTEVNYNEFEALRNHTIYYFYKKEDGQILLCATSGLYELDIEKGIIGRYSSEGKGKFYIPSKDIRHLYFDKKNKTYWLATGNEGLIEWSPTTAQSNVYKLHRLEANTIHSVYPDDFGFLWLSTENGIMQFNRKSKRFKAYLPIDGTSSHEFNRIAHLQDKDGTIYFGSINGVTSFHPKDFADEVEQQEKVNLVVVEFNQFSSQTSTIENRTAIFQKEKTVQLKAGDRFFRMILALDDYSHNSEAIYYYKIKTDEDWSKTKSNEIEVSGLPYGTHILELKGLLTNGQFSETLSIPVRVFRPFYLTWWFLLLVAALIIGVSFGVTHWRTQFLTIQKTILEKEVATRTAQIEAQAERLKTLDETKSRFFANVSHELRTPITMIQGPVQSVLNSQNLNNRNYTLLAKAEQNTKNLLNLVDEILDLTRLESSQLRLNESNVVFYPYLRRIISNFQSIADKKQIEFLLEYDCARNLQLKLDKGKFEKIINNLVSNAFKFTPRKGSIHIKVLDNQLSDFSNDGNGILIIVKDTGRGISKVDIPNVFNRFFQSSTNRQAEGGLGIGLALSMEFVKLMNGKMWVESETVGEGRGSTFYFQFPKKEVIAMNPVPVVDEKSSIPPLILLPTSVDSRDKETILLVEDNIDLQEYIQFLLAPYYNIIIAENGKEALAQLKNTLIDGRKELPSIIVSDVMMPIMGGFEFLECLKSNDYWRHIPVIMLTARAELKDKLKALRIGVDGYLVKPFKEEELLVRIKNLLTNYKVRQQTPSLVSADIESDKVERTEFIISEKEQIWLTNFEALVLKNLEDARFSVSYLAELQNITRRTLSSKIKRLTGLTTNQYIRTVRLNLAKDLLEQQKCGTVTEVAHRVGFQKVEYFSKIYKETYGKLPSEYL